MTISNNGEGSEIDQLRRKIEELEIAFGDAPTRAEFAENSLNRIYRSPAWKLSKPLRLINLIAWKLKPSLLDPLSKNVELASTGPSVFELTKDSIKFEHENCDFDSQKIAIIAQWSESEKLPNSTSKYIEELHRNGFSTIVVSTSPTHEKLELSENAKSVSTVIRRSNVGYDFGSWSTAFHLYPELFSKNEILITNDSCYGPFGDLSKTLESARKSPYDVTSLTDSNYKRYHLQSYFLFFKNQSLKQKSLKRFWLEVRPQPEKMSVVLAYEIGLTARAQWNGLFTGSLYPWNSVLTNAGNPSVEGWERLLESGFPFIKREVIRQLGNSSRKKLGQDLVSKFECHPEILADILNDDEIR